MLGIKRLIVIGITGATFLALRPIRFDREAERTTVNSLLIYAILTAKAKARYPLTRRWPPLTRRCKAS